jgi:hypothetical protein
MVTAKILTTDERKRCMCIGDSSGASAECSSASGLTSKYSRGTARMWIGNGSVCKGTSEYAASTAPSCPTSSRTCADSVMLVGTHTTSQLVCHGSPVWRCYQCSQAHAQVAQASACSTRHAAWCSMKLLVCVRNPPRAWCSPGLWLPAGGPPPACQTAARSYPPSGMHAFACRLLASRRSAAP